VPTINHAVATAMASNAILLHLLKFLRARDGTTGEEARALLLDAQIDLRQQDTFVVLSAFAPQTPQRAASLISWAFT